MTVRVERDGRVTMITLDRPERRNAIDHPTLLKLLDVQADIATRSPSETRVVVLTGTTPAFSAGADLNGVEAGRFATDLRRVLVGFGQLPVPVIAAISGPALGAGTQLAIAADLRIATPDSPLGIPAARLGISVDHWTIRRLRDEFTAPVARAMLVGTENYTAERLYALGGIHRLGDLSDAQEWAQRLAQFAPLTVVAHKLGLENVDLEVPTVDAFEAARRAAWASNDADEGRTAFLEKRVAKFTAS
ncbi:MAG: enoyl-CoA hydratase-related protein [Ilumatobacter sp.]|nr:enoyl-CoA hydratase-related protein [Ilumatobacter sp.]